MTNKMFTLVLFSATVFASFTAMPEAAAQTNATDTTNVESTKQIVTQAVYDAKQAEINDLKAQIAKVDAKPETATNLEHITNLRARMAAPGGLSRASMKSLEKTEAFYATYFANKAQLAVLEAQFALMEVSKEIEPKAGPETNDNDFGTDEETNSTLENSTEVSGNQPK